MLAGWVISTRAPREGSDSCAYGDHYYTCISTRAPREGSDDNLPGLVLFFGYFYPRSPRGERPMQLEPATGVSLFLPALPARGATCSALIFLQICKFLPALPARGATFCRLRFLIRADISTRAPREGSDRARQEMGFVQ